MILFNPDLKIFYSTKINDNQYLAGFSTRAPGDARDSRVIFRLLDQNKIAYKKLAVPDQIHSVNIQFFDAGEGPILAKIADTDGVVTDAYDTVLSVRTADCLPLIFADKKLGVIGISHQGWRGSLKKMALKMVDVFVQKGSRRQDIVVAFGPAIGACCYDVNDDRYYQFLEIFDGYSDKIFHLEKGKKHLNLPLLNYLQLLDDGIKKEQIDFFPFCTKCDKERFFSFRRDQKKNQGHMFNFVLKKHA